MVKEETKANRILSRQHQHAMPLANSKYVIRKKTSKRTSACHVCQIDFLPGELQAGVWGQFGTSGSGFLLQRPRHVTCIGARTARAMCGGSDRHGSKVSNGVTFFCSDDERKHACDQIKRVAWGIKGEE